MMLLFKLDTRLQWLGLNVIRALSMTTLALVIASSIAVMVRDANAICREMKTSGRPEINELNSKPSIEPAYIPSSTVPFQPGGPFFAILSRLLIVCQCLILILAELKWPKGLFTKFLPILGPRYSVGIPGTSQVMYVTLILSHHIPKFALVPAILLFAMGCLNIILGPVFRENIHLYRARATVKLKNGHPEENQPLNQNQPLNRRISFRPGRGRPTTQSPGTGSTIHTGIEKQPSYENWYGSKSDAWPSDSAICRKGWVFNSLPRASAPQVLVASPGLSNLPKRMGVQFPPPSKRTPSTSR
ncbi:hypothetical protein RSAG8_10351, partial [Rhizoctonia solani AG-8 WAC10335]